ncbi:MAG TPA: AMP-binding protein, partial [Chroococcidiopsis sp.]
MISTPVINRAPLHSPELQPGQTLIALLDQGCDRYPNDQALNQWQRRAWQPLSNTDFRQAVEECALGLRLLGVERGDRIALVMHSDLGFGLVDLGSLLAGLVTVPIDLTQTIENILFILHHTEARVLVVSTMALLDQVMPYLAGAPHLQWVIVGEVPADWDATRAQITDHAAAPALDSVEIPHPSNACLQIPHFLAEPHAVPAHSPAVLPQCVRLLSLDEVRQRGRQQWSQPALTALRQAIAPDDLATIVYIASETQRPKGVMLSHANISADILSAFASQPNLETGANESALLFLPLTHIFARAFFYGHLAYGHSLYFSDPNHVVKHLQSVRPTILITVPRLLEKVCDRILEQGQRLSRFDGAVFRWALKLAQRYQLGQPISRLYALQLQLADRLVFAKWRAVFGDRIKAVISGGAALRADIANLFSAAGIPLLQGYGLTETSAVLCYTRGHYNRAGTVGVPIPGVEIRLADDGEIWVRSPFVMQGYYRDPEATQRVLDPDGWLHTGDLGTLSADGFLQITGVKKSLFKLSTGKYVSSLPLEQELERSSLISHAIAVGANHKFCGMLIF